MKDGSSLKKIKVNDKIAYFSKNGDRPATLLDDATPARIGADPPTGMPIYELIGHDDRLYQTRGYAVELKPGEEKEGDILYYPEKIPLRLLPCKDRNEYHAWWETRRRLKEQIFNEQ
ncbi:MAG: hypothetical protein HYW24_03000 [Candidatus Aenigmarchaeota archaeon]|nr:hypothetical protein [Candidatus Aenigmarchaeota archaeon]